MEPADNLRHGRPAVDRGISSLRPAYLKKWGVVIGIDHYQHLSPLRYALTDAQAVARMLRETFGFDQVITLYDEAATLKAVQHLLVNLLPEQAGADDCVVVFFAGHGEKRILPARPARGFLAPCDAQRGDWTTFLPVEHLVQASNDTSAKHLLYLVDSCYSGFATVRSANFNPTRFHRDVLTIRARQVLTAGLDDQVVDDVGPNDHSIFTYHLLEGLKGEAALSDDGTVTATELMAYVKTSVGKNQRSRQTPDYGYLPGHQSGGDFVFEAPANRMRSRLSYKQIIEEAISELSGPSSDPQKLLEKLRQSLNNQGAYERADTPKRLSSTVADRFL
jgi:hypothetical protein